MRTISTTILMVCLFQVAIAQSPVTGNAPSPEVLRRLTDSLRTELSNLKDYKSILDEKLANKTAELENRHASFENKHQLYVILLSIFGVGSVIGVSAGFVFAKRIVQDRLIKLFEENNQDIIRLFKERSEERILRQGKHIVIISPKNMDEMMAFQLKAWQFEKITPIEVTPGDAFPSLTVTPDAIFFNNKSKGLDDKIPEIIEHYKNAHPNAVLFYFGSKRLPDSMSDFVAMANLQTQIPGNLLNALKFSQKI